ncbi:hypothetical protein MSPP1_004197 [Malassezia sp. CBS 17886]|nr:hypothetical protein MSPP1_004197 [Malassezia sp. CBS 17886]
MPTVTFDYVRADEVRAAHALLAASLPREEASTMAQLLKRHDEAPHLFFGAFVSLPPPKVAGPLSVSMLDVRRRLVAFVCGSVAPAFVAQSMYGSTQSDLARVVCIHEVCVDPGSRKKGIGLRLLRKFVERLQQDAASRHTYEVVSALSPKRRIAFYEHAGFKCHGASYVLRDAEPWFEMRRSLLVDDGDRLADTSFTAADILEAEAGLGSNMPLVPGQPQPVYYPAASRPTADDSGLEPQQLGFDAPMRDAADAQDLSASQTPNLEATPPNSWGMGSLTMSPTTSTSAPASDQLLSTLVASASLSDGAARDLGLSGRPRADSSGTGRRPVNPGKELSVIYGQAVAAKTPSEDSLAALEARIVDRATELNRCRLYCPNGDCNCVIVAKNSARWEVKEIGPATAQDGSYSWLGPVFHSVYERFAVPKATIGPIRGFWELGSPMQFENVSFSRNVVWRVPEPILESGQPASRSPTPLQEAQFRRENPQRKRSDRDMLRTLSSGKRGGVRPMEPVETRSALPARNVSLGVSPGEERTVKFILCPDCGNGPLGFMILPADYDVEKGARGGYADQTCYVGGYRLRYDL